MNQESIRSKAIQKARVIFRQNSGLLRTSEALQSGISPTTLYQMRDAGYIVQENRGLYRLADAEPLGYPDQVQVAKLVPKAVICLISALSFHDLTSQIPHHVWIALPRSSQRPRLAYPSLEVIWLPENAFEAGIEEHNLDGVPVRIYSREKTIADCFRYEKRVGKEVVLEALRNYRRQGKVNITALMEYARTDRVDEKMKPYLEALL